MPFTTFGTTTIPTGGSNLTLFHDNVWLNDKQTLSQAGHATSGAFYMQNNGGGDISCRMVVYDATGTGGAPGALLGTSDESVFPQVGSGDGPKWMTFNFSTPVVMPAGDYYLGYFSSSDQGIAKTSGSGTVYSSAGVYPTAPNPFGTASTTGPDGWGIYVTYHIDSGGNDAPTNSVAPSISGTASTGNTLTATTGTWLAWPTATFTYQWQKSTDGGNTFSNIVSATSSTYTIVSGDTGCAFRCAVTATNAAGNSTVNTAPIGWSYSLPLSSPPAYYATAAWSTAGNRRNGLFYVGEQVTIPGVSTSATGYTVRDYYGNVVSSGSLSSQSTCTPTPPNGFVGTGVFGAAGGQVGPDSGGGGWDPGWYRIYFTQGTLDPIYGYSCGATNFVVVKDDPNFPRMPVTVTGAFRPDGLWDTDGFPDQLALSVLGIPPQRLPAYHDDSEFNPSLHTQTVMDGKVYPAAQQAQGNWLNSHVDPNRPRYLWASYNVSGMDTVAIPNNGTGNWAFVQAKNGTMAAQGDKIFVQLAAGTSSGSKVTVRYPDSSTVVETYDNLASASAFVSAVVSSSYIQAAVGDGGTAASSMAATAIGNYIYNGIVYGVGKLASAGVTRFEGTTNEPGLNSSFSAGLAMGQGLFKAAVHQGNASAKAIGPTPVSLDTSPFQNAIDIGWISQVDEIAVHGYNSLYNSDINLGRNVLDAFFNLLSANGITKPVWQTESTHALTNQWGVHHPRLSHQMLAQMLLWEQYGVPRERNTLWYSLSHGFWDYPAWAENGDMSLQPHALMARVLCEETFGKTHFQQLDFGTPGNDLYIGSIYKNPTSGESVAAVMAGSYFPNGSLTFTVSGTANPLNWTDGLGKTHTVAQSGGKVTIPMTDVPAYLRLPAGVTVTVSGVNGFAVTPTSTVTPSACTVGSVSTSVPIDGGFMTHWVGGTGSFTSSNVVPEDVTITWASPASINRVVIWCGAAWQTYTTLLAYDIQTTTDGVNWMTQKSVDRSAAATSFIHGTDTNNLACVRETFWEQHGMHDIALDSTVNNVIGVRLHVTKCSYGGAPDLPCCLVGDQATTQRITLQEVGLYNCPSA